MYDRLARFYDLIHAELVADIPLVLELALQVEGPVLELGCGSGRLLLPLAAAGKQVVGVDDSQEMLAKARAKVNLLTPEGAVRIELVKADFRELALGRRFDLVLLPYNTLFHLDDTGLRQTLRVAHRHLAPPGMLLIDLENPLAMESDFGENVLQLERTMVEAETDSWIVQQSSRSLDRERKVIHVAWLFDVSPRQGGPVHRTIIERDLHYWYAHELELALQEAALVMDAIYGDYERGPYREESERLLIVASRAD
jgi:SAM-dependent methyltransferase